MAGGLGLRAASFSGNSTIRPTQALGAPNTMPVLKPACRMIIDIDKAITLYAMYKARITQQACG
ncbi:MAG: hypothetical protein VX211_08630 [Pseudomonadota bacterium]|nr:hypothetical protein [Pseudomonadota bacterium]